MKIPFKRLCPYISEEQTLFTYDYNHKTRSIKYGHPQGFHDDTVISLALANYSRKQMKSYGQYAVMGKR